MTKQQMPLWLNETEIRAALSMPDLIEAMQSALSAFSAGEVNQPVRTVIEVDRIPSFFAVMPAHAKNIPALGAKLVTVFGKNPALGLHSHLATILLLDPHTGEMLAVMDGRFITEARTAAVSAVATRFLAGKKTPVLAILGSGVQARSHLEALRLVRSFDEIRCWSPTPANLNQFASGFAEVQPAASAEAAVRDADVVALVTSSPQPVIRSEWVKAGALVISVGACRPSQREMDPALVERARVVVDSRASALQESGDIVLGIHEGRFGADHIAAELGEVVANPERGRRNEDEIVVVKPLGLAIEDLAAAHLAFTRARANGRGLPLA